MKICPHGSQEVFLLKYKRQIEQHSVLLWEKSSDISLKLSSWLVLFDFQLSFTILEPTLFGLVVMTSSLLESLWMIIRLSIKTLKFVLIEIP